MNSSFINWRSIWNKPTSSFPKNIEEAFKIDGFDSLSEQISSEKWLEYARIITKELNINNGDIINAIPKGLDSIPMGPITMMRNQLNLEGGTKALYRTEEWAESVHFWQKYAAIEPNI